MHYEKDLKTQLRYLQYLGDEVNMRIANIQDYGTKILYSPDAQERIMRFYIESAEEMGVPVSEEFTNEWLPERKEIAIPST